MGNVVGVAYKMGGSVSVNKSNEPFHTEEVGHDHVRLHSNDVSAFF